MASTYLRVFNNHLTASFRPLLYLTTMILVRASYLQQVFSAHDNLIDFSECLNSAEDPPNAMFFTIPEALDEVFPGEEFGSSELLRALIIHVLSNQSPVLFQGSEWKFRR
jgi:hypothetical protein